MLLIVVAMLLWMGIVCQVRRLRPARPRLGCSLCAPVVGGGAVLVLTGNDGDLRLLLDDLDPVDIRNVAEALDDMRSRVGTEPREDDGTSHPHAEPLSECSGLRSSVPPSFFPESRLSRRRSFNYAEAYRRWTEDGESQPMLAQAYKVTIDGIRYGLAIARREGAAADVPVRRIQPEPKGLILPPNCGYCGRRYSKRWLDRHESRCRREASDRYQILAVSGFRIDPRTSMSSKAGGRNTPTTYVVCDSAEAWIEVGWFEPNEKARTETCRQRAEAMCRRLNAQEIAA